MVAPPPTPRSFAVDVARVSAAFQDLARQMGTQFLDKQEIIFEPFAQADASATREHGGTGLGLAISKRLVDMMGGTISYTSEIHKGTVFRVAIPTEAVDVATVRLPADLQRIDSPHSLPRLNCRVLVVDDRREIRYLVRQFIEEAGGQVKDVVAVDGAALAVHGQATVGVPVEGQAQVEATLSHVGGQSVEMERAAAQVDVAAVGRAADARHLGPQLVEDQRRQRGGRAVRAVEQQTDAVEAAGGDDGLQEPDVVVHQRGVLGHRCVVLRQNFVHFV